VAGILISLLTNAIELPPLANSITILILSCLTLVLVNVTVLQFDLQHDPGERRKILKALLVPVMATVLLTGVLGVTIVQKGQIEQEREQLGEEKRSFEKTRKMQLKQLRIGFLPVGDKLTNQADHRPFENNLEDRLGIQVSSHYPGTTYTDTVNALAQESVDMAWLGPFSYLYAVERCQPKLLLCTLNEEGRSFYYSYIIARAAGNIHSLQDLKGKTFTIVDELSTSGYLFPRYLFKKAGIDLQQDLTLKIGGSHQQVLQAVLDGKTTAGAISSILYNEAVAQGRINKNDIVILNSDYTNYRIPSGPIVLRKDIQAYDALRVEDAFLTIAEDNPLVLNTLDTGGFAKVTDNTYQLIRDITQELHVDISKLKAAI
jgi:phosphonate transport system substrate-binding protein